MPIAKNLTAYEDAHELLLKAVESSKGLAVNCPSERAAHALRWRLYGARRAAQRENAKTFPKDHELHGRSHFDAMTFKVEGKTLNIINSAAVEYEIRSL